MSPSQFLARFNPFSTAAEAKRDTPSPAPQQPRRTNSANSYISMEAEDFFAPPRARTMSDRF